MTGTTSQLSQLKTQILVVEDEVVIARDIEDCLENLGYSVAAIAHSGVEAIAKTAQLRPNLVLMDIRLEGEMDGIQAAEQIWGNYKIPVVYVTGFSDRNTLERAKLTRPFGYILKPVEERELYVAIETALQQYRATQEIQNREQWLTTILRDIGDGVIVVDRQGRVKFLNLIATALTGWTQEEAVGRDLIEIFPLIHEQTRTQIENPAIATLQSGRLLYLPDQTLLVSRTGNLLPVADSIAPLRNNSGDITGAVVVFRDITQRRLSEEHDLALQRARQLEQQMQELQRLDQLRDEFISTVSHELRTPLANMKMAIHMLEIYLDQQGVLRSHNDSETNRITRYFEILRSQCHQELDLVNNLLNLQHLNTNTYSLIPISIPLQNWVPVLVENFSQRFQINQQELVIDIPADLPTLISDEPSLFRILSELLNNACKYTPAGERIVVSVKIVQEAGNTEEARETREAEITQSPPHSLFEIIVANTGVEISAEELPRIFEEFYRVPRLDVRKQSGTGLGLALVKKLVRYLGGTIRVESGSGETRFIVHLPPQLPEQTECADSRGSRNE
ncbi:ATP-binding protein [Leptothermofonsia sp. ETS-13]|uniref:hybrid sensor histidine kinase/response regulator n=1 Tax=Leptothermofonsia sp. ETS-13 TaxID=3035696 RepID=UPI003BA25845